MRPVTASSLALLAALFWYRGFLTSLRHFSGVLTQHPATSLVPGILSDLACSALLLAMALLVEMAFLKFIPSLWQRFHRTFLWSLVSIGSLALAMHLRMVEHFGWSVRPDQFHLIKSLTSANVGLRLFFESWRAWLMLLMPFLFFYLALHLNKRAEKPLLPLARILLVFFCSLACFYGSEKLATSWQTHQELRRTALLQVATNFWEYHLANPTIDHLAAHDITTLRQHFSTDRPWQHDTPSDQAISPVLPFFQSRLHQGRPVDQDAEQLRLKLINFLKREAAEKGPWNIMLVQQESLRAHEITAFGSGADPRFHHAAPNLSRIFSQNIRFTSVIATGNLTHYGELAAGCSLYATPYTNVLFDNPTASVICLSDILAAKGYQTYFACGTDGATNNRNIFYPKHHIQNFLSLGSGLPSRPRGAWGLSDELVYRSLLDRLIEQHKAGQQPFFAHLLTLSNHIPRDTPEDMPADLVKLVGIGNRQEMLVRYIDWAFGRFYERLERELPHTLVWFTADHGEWPAIGYPQEHPSVADIRLYSRIPVGLLIPGLPADLAGAEINLLGSDVDTAPTLLDLLGYAQHGNQFMGMSLFRRNEPVIVKWGDAWRSLTSQAGSSGDAFHVSEEWSQANRILWSAPGKLNLLAPQTAHH